MYALLILTSCTCTPVHVRTATVAANTVPCSIYMQKVHIGLRTCTVYIYILVPWWANY